MDQICEWTSCGVNWETLCGHVYFPYVKSFDQPKIVDNVCPWCQKKISYEEHNDEE